MELNKSQNKGCFGSIIMKDKGKSLKDSVNLQVTYPHNRIKSKIL